MSVGRRGRKVSCDVEEILSPRKKRTEINGQIRMKTCVVRVKPLSQNEVKQYEVPSSDQNGIMDLNRKFIKNEIVIVEDLKEELIRKDTQIKALQHQLDKERSKYDALVANSRQQQLENLQMIAKQIENIQQLTKANEELKNLIKDLKEKNLILSANTSSTLNPDEQVYAEIEPQSAEQNLVGVTEDIVQLDPQVTPLKMEIQESLDELKFPEALDDIYSPEDIIFPNIDYEDLSHVPLSFSKPDFVTMENLKMSQGIVQIVLPKETEDELATGSSSNHVTSLEETVLSTKNQVLSTDKPVLVYKGKGFVEKSVSKKKITMMSYNCQLCGYSTKLKDQFESHAGLHTGVRSRTDIPNIKIGSLPCFECSLCSYVTHRKTNFIKHQKIHGDSLWSVKKEPLDDGYSPSQITPPKSEVKCVVKKVYKCERCDYACSKKYNFTTHKCGSTTKRPYKCSLCHYACKARTDLTKHHRTHTGEKPFKCDLCDFASAFKCNLVVHRRNHTGERPYKCEQCLRCYKQKSDLNKHQKVHNKTDLHLNRINAIANVPIGPFTVFESIA